MEGMREKRSRGMRAGEKWMDGERGRTRLL